MTVAPDTARVFIDTYKRVLLEVAGVAASPPNGTELYSILADGRAKLSASPNLFDVVASRISGLDESTREALRRLSLRRWVYLRDTAHYSVFLELGTKHAYAVVGLTQRLRDLFGCTGILVETAILPLDDHYVCDGLFATPVILGRNMLSDFRDLFSDIKDAGNFHRRPGPPSTR